MSPGTPHCTGAWFRTNHVPVDGRNTAQSVVAVAVVVAGHRDVAGNAPLDRGLILHEPVAGLTAETPRGPPCRRRCSRRAPGCRREARTAPGPWPCENHSPVDGPKHRDVVRAIPVEVRSGRRHSIDRDRPAHAACRYRRRTRRVILSFHVPLAAAPDLPLNVESGCLRTEAADEGRGSVRDQSWPPSRRRSSCDVSGVHALP